jgi:hypothetical protein
MSRGAAALASLLVTLGRPAWWALALTAFLLRGGLVLYLVPIVSFPSPLAVSNVVGPLIVPLALGRIGVEVVILVGLTVGALLVWLVGGWALAAAAEGALIRDVAEAAAEEGLGGRDERRPADAGGVARRMVAARLVALIPLVVAIGWGAVAIVGSAYVELTRPLDVATPLAVRVAAGAAGQIAAIVVAWLFAEIVGGAAGRRAALDDASAGQALAAAIRDLVRRPASTVLPWLATTALMALVLGPLLLAADVAWRALQAGLVDPDASPVATALALLAFVGIWLSGLVVGGLLAAVRTAAGVVEASRSAHRSASRNGTFGAGAHRRPGDWSVGDEGGSL